MSVFLTSTQCALVVAILVALVLDARLDGGDA